MWHLTTVEAALHATENERLNDVPDSFVHLHQHTEYSMLDGASRINDAVEAAAADGQPAMGITDHGNMYGVIPFYKACREHGIKPIIGTEAYMAYDTRFERPARKGKMDDSGGEAEGGHKPYYHITLLAENQEGYKNLIQLASRAYLEGYYYKPRVDWELLSHHSKGVIATTGCLGGHVLQALMNDGYDAALVKAARLQEIFGRDNLFVEIQDHGIDEQHQTNPQLFRIAKELGAPLLLTNDSHYVHEHDAVAHDALLCVQTGAKIADEDRFKFEGKEHYIKSASQMRSLFGDEGKEACDSTLWIAERCELEIPFGEYKLPHFPLPEGFDDSGEYLKHLSFEGAKERYGDPLPEEVVERLAYELQVIDDMGFSAYFLITGDLMDHARNSNIAVGPARGSAGGSLVAYCMGITKIDPIKYDLLFERFLNPSRISMPDIDMDFDSRYRDEMIRYAAEKYGRDHVAQIITFSTIKARAAVRDAARVLDKPFMVGDKIAKAMPPLIMGRDTPLKACFEEDPKYRDGYRMAQELRDMVDSDPEAQEVVSVARGLENLRRQDGIHAAAVVISPEPLTEYVPVQRKAGPGQRPEDAPIVTQYEMGAVEDLGLLKMDFLGVRNLDIMQDALALIKKTKDIDIDIDNIPLDDEKTFELLRRSDTIGVFQLESNNMRALMRSLEPTTFDDVAALVALFRPGPMAVNMHNDYADRKNGRREVEYFHPDAEEALGDTYGLMIYQEGVMKVAQQFAGYSLAEADNLRKACGKKVRELMEKEREKFVDGVEKTGYGRELGVKLFSIIENFADYAFNKSHSYGYGMISYQTAYLKANYPTEYLSAVLSSVKDKQERLAVYLSACRSSGIDVSVPDINVSESDFVPSGNSILFGLSAIRYVGDGVVTKIMLDRAAGPFADFYDFCNRVDKDVLNKRTLESLIKAGAFESVGHPRKGLLEVFDAVSKDIIKRRKKAGKGTDNEFPSLDDPRTEGDEIPDDEFDKKEKIALEKEMLGLYVSDHPLFDVEEELAQVTDCLIGEVEESSLERIVLGGILTSVEHKRTKKGDMMAKFNLEDLTGSIEVLLFPRQYQLIDTEMLDSDEVMVIQGKLDRRDDVAKLILDDIQVFTPSATASSAVVFRVAEGKVNEEFMSEFREICGLYPGKSPVFIFSGPEAFDANSLVDNTDEFRRAVSTLFTEFVF